MEYNSISYWMEYNSPIAIKKRNLIGVVGPTAVGKTSIALAVAKHFHSEIISCDSRQLYKEMTIGTAIPTQKELQAIPHHFIQEFSIDQPVSAAMYEQLASERLEDRFENHSVLILTGGSGLFEQALAKGLDEIPEIPSIIRDKITDEYELKGLGYLRKELKKKDPVYFKKVDQYNSRRLIRALEVCECTKKPYSSFLNQKKKKKNFRTLRVGLYLDREILYQRINDRVDDMFEMGLIEEARKLYPKRDMQALRTVGYQELFEYFDGSISLEKAREEIKKNTRRYAKRQMTWYREQMDIRWFSPNEIAKIIDYLNHQLESEIK